jgi:hypothetical protein
MAIQTSIRAGQDPTLVPGIYNMCDQWCMYCHATAWCLSYRLSSREQAESGDVSRNVTARLVKGVMLLKQLWEEEGRAPEALGAIP